MSKRLGLNDWWAIKREHDGYLFTALECTRADAIKRFMAMVFGPPKERHPEAPTWRQLREGRSSWGRHSAVRVTLAERIEE